MADVPGPGPIKALGNGDFDEILAVINAAAASYRGIIPPERSLDPYMPCEELREELDLGVEFWGHVERGTLRGVMGIQGVADVVLIRHAYTRPDAQGLGIGSGLLGFLVKRTKQPILIGTWAGARRSIAFYERHGFSRVPAGAILALLEKYWCVPAAQAAASVVLANVPVDRLRY